MKSTLKNLVTVIVLLSGLAFCLSGCYETHYYHYYSHHSRGWYDHRHREPPSGINFEIDVYQRRHH